MAGKRRNPRNNARTEELKERHLTETARMYLEGRTQYEIAERLGLSQTQVSRDLEEVRTRWRVSMLRNFGEAVARELAKLDAIEAEAWEAYRRTVGLHKRTTKVDTQKVAGDMLIPVSEERVQAERLAGDPRFLDVALRCSNERRKLLGLDAPERLELYGSESEQRDRSRDGLFNKLRASVEAARPKLDAPSAAN